MMVTIPVPVLSGWTNPFPTLLKGSGSAARPSLGALHFLAGFGGGMPFGVRRPSLTKMDQDVFSMTASSLDIRMRKIKIDGHVVDPSCTLHFIDGTGLRDKDIPKSPYCTRLEGESNYPEISRIELLFVNYYNPMDGVITQALLGLSFANANQVRAHFVIDSQKELDRLSGSNYHEAITKVNAMMDILNELGSGRSSFTNPSETRAALQASLEKTPWMSAIKTKAQKALFDAAVKATFSKEVVAKLGKLGLLYGSVSRSSAILANINKDSVGPVDAAQAAIDFGFIYYSIKALQTGTKFNPLATVVLWVCQKSLDYYVSTHGGEQQ